MNQGFTLLELMVVIVLLGISFGVVVFTWPGEPGAAALPTEPARLSAVVDQAAQERRSKTVVVPLPNGEYGLVTALPDGRLILPEGLEYPRLETGQQDLRPAPQRHARPSKARGREEPGDRW